MANSAKSKIADEKKTRAEQHFKVRSVSRGIAIGKIVSLHGQNRQFYRVNLRENQIEAETKRFRAAVSLARRQLKKLGTGNSEIFSETQSAIFDTHQLFLEDAALSEKIENLIQNKKVNAEWAVKFVTDRYISVYKDFQDEYLRERHIDLQDVAERILSALDSKSKKPNLQKNTVIAASIIKPSTIVELGQENIIGIVAENGGWTSHSFILAREFGIPAVTGVKSLMRRIKNGDVIIIDGYEGKVILNPAEETLRFYQNRRQSGQQSLLASDDFSDAPIKTLDGKLIKIRANLDSRKGYSRAKQFGAKGIGLFRSEYLFNTGKGIPTEKNQLEAYRKIALSAGEDGVKIRTFDLNVEQISSDRSERETNPALGLRAVRLSLSRPKFFQTQIRALLQAAHNTTLDILLPMISDVEEIRDVKKIIESEKRKLEKQNIKTGNPKIGTMIELPSAVLMIDEIAAESDFFNVGTNDLVQYILGVDRDNELVADRFRTLHPAVLRSLKKIIEAGEKHSIPVIICGEMAGSPVYAPLLIGLGATELSMNAPAMPRVLTVIKNIAFEEARELAESLLSCPTASDAEKAVQKKLPEKWLHLYPPDIFSDSKK